VAISKDGNRLAAISTQVDTSIYVYKPQGSYRVILETRNEFGVNGITREAYFTVSVPTGITGTTAGVFRAYPNPDRNQQKADQPGGY